MSQALLSENWGCVSLFLAFNLVHINKLSQLIQALLPRIGFDILFTMTTKKGKRGTMRCVPPRFPTTRLDITVSALSGHASLSGFL